MDTNSLYFAVSGSPVENILKPGVRETYFRESHLWLPSEHCVSPQCITDYVATKDNHQPWVMHLWCQVKFMFDKRMPAHAHLLKLEF